jgi:PAS domain S-box-containing protein
MTEESKEKIQTLEKQLAECRLAYETVKKSEAILSLIVEGSSIPTLVIDKNHVITHCNKAYEKFKGIPAHRMIGTKNQWMTFYSKPKPVMMDFIVDQVPEQDILKYFGSRAQKSTVAEGAFEAEIFSPDLGDSGQWLFFTAAPLKGKDGQIVGAVETFQDVTQRRRTEEALRDSERRFRKLLDFVPYPIGVFNMEGLPTYLNPRFTQVLGWTLQELKGKKIPFVPEEAKRETIENLKRLYKEKILIRHESKRLTKDGRVLDMAIRAAVYSESGQGPSGVIAIFRDITREKRIARINEAMLHLSLALPRYPDLGGLLDYVNSEVKRLTDSEGSVVMLLDKEKEEFHVIGAAYDTTDTQKRVKEVRFSMDQLVSSKVVRTGKPIIVSDTSLDRHLHEERDRKLGYKTRNLAIVPLKGRERIGGVLCAINKKAAAFNQEDIEVLEMISGAVALSIQNARVSEKLKRAYKEVSSMNRAKDKMINHLSHELRTPLAVLAGALTLIERRLDTIPDDTWKATMNMMKRNLDRIKDIQIEVEDIMEEREFKSYAVLSILLEQCADELAVLAAEQCPEGSLVEALRERIDELFGPKDLVPVEINLDRTVRERIEDLKPLFSHRDLMISSQLEAVPSILIPQEVLYKVIDGLIKNAVENTPDEGKIEIAVQKKGEGALLIVRDYGVGIPEDARKRIFEGFFSTRDTMAYSSKRPFDFNAGGKGADLLRMKIFSERYHFQIDMASTRCKHLPKETDVCPGRISKCAYCSEIENCHKTGGTIFSLYFPPATQESA